MADGVAAGADGVAAGAAELSEKACGFWLTAPAP
jgi:hypothetical protein